MNKAIARHCAAIKAGEVTKTNVIGMRNALNASDLGFLRREADPDLEEQIIAAHDLIVQHRPRVVGDLHDSGIKHLQNPRYRKRWTDWQARAIADIAEFRLIGFEQRRRTFHPIYSVWAKVPPCTGADPFPEGVIYEAFHFINVPWQSGGNGPEIIS